MHTTRGVTAITVSINAARADHTTVVVMLCLLGDLACGPALHHRYI